MWGTQRRNQITFDVGDRAGGGIGQSLRERLLTALNGELGNLVVPVRSATIAPDICFKVPGTNRAGVVELKIGDPSLPLPSSTIVQMMRLVQSVGSDDALAPPLTPIVVTNYLVSEEQERELLANRIQLVRLVQNMTPSRIAEQVKSALSKQ